MINRGVGDILTCLYSYNNVTQTVQKLKNLNFRKLNLKGFFFALIYIHLFRLRPGVASHSRKLIFKMIFGTVDLITSSTFFNMVAYANCFSPADDR